ncbi:hypothetical protein [Streptomyces sp. NPDC091371]
MGAQSMSGLVAQGASAGSGTTASAEGFLPVVWDRILPVTLDGPEDDQWT